MLLFEAMVICMHQFLLAHMPTFLSKEGLFMFPITHVLPLGGVASLHNEDDGMILMMLDVYCSVMQICMIYSGCGY